MKFLTTENILADPVGCVYDAVLHDHGRNADRLVCNLRASLACKDYASAFVLAIALECTRDRNDVDADAAAGLVRLERLERAAAMLTELHKNLRVDTAAQNGTLRP